jgi:hypothetical protein
VGRGPLDAPHPPSCPVRTARANIPLCVEPAWQNDPKQNSARFEGFINGKSFRLGSEAHLGEFDYGQASHPSRNCCTAFKLASLIETPGAFLLLRRPPGSFVISTEMQSTFPWSFLTIRRVRRSHRGSTAKNPSRRHRSQLELVTPSQAGVVGPFRPPVPGGRKRQTAVTDARLTAWPPPLDRNHGRPLRSTPATAQLPFKIEDLRAGAPSGPQQSLRR